MKNAGQLIPPKEEPRSEGVRTGSQLSHAASPIWCDIEISVNVSAEF